MPRPRKCRKVCCMPENTEFAPVNCMKAEKTVILNVDEYEAVRLIDKEGFSQEEIEMYERLDEKRNQNIRNAIR